MSMPRTTPTRAAARAPSPRSQKRPPPRRARPPFAAPPATAGHTAAPPAQLQTEQTSARKTQRRKQLTSDVVVHADRHLHHAAHAALRAARAPTARADRELVREAQRAPAERRREVRGERERVRVCGRVSMSIRRKEREREGDAQLRDSPGRSERSTASIACGTSKVGRGVSGSTSSAPHPAAGVGGSGAAGVDGDASRLCESWRGRVMGDHDADGGSASEGVDMLVRLPSAGVGVAAPEPRAGASRPSNPLEKDVDRRCGRSGARRARSEEEMSMLPPPTTALRVSAARTPATARVCSGGPAAGGSTSVPVSCAYA